MNNRILVLEDEPTCKRLIQATLIKHGFQVVLIDNGKQLITTIESFRPDLVVVDNVPGSTCLESCERVRSHTTYSFMPLIIYSSNLDENLSVDLFIAGAKAVIPKSLSPQILAAQAASILSRNKQERIITRELLIYKTLEIDPLNGVTICGRHIKLTPYEFRLLTLLASAPDITFSREEILSALKNTIIRDCGRVVDVLILHLRKKLGIYGQCIATVRSQGYSFVLPKRLKPC